MSDRAYTPVSLIGGRGHGFSYIGPAAYWRANCRAWELMDKIPSSMPGYFYSACRQKAALTLIQREYIIDQATKVRRGIRIPKSGKVQQWLAQIEHKPAVTNELYQTSVQHCRGGKASCIKNNSQQICVAGILHQLSLPASLQSAKYYKSILAYPQLREDEQPNPQVISKRPKPESSVSPDPWKPEIPPEAQRTAPAPGAGKEPNPPGSGQSACHA
jgi:hypothetical protein